MRSYQRSINVEGKVNTAVLETAGITEAQSKEMYRYLGLANYEDRFVVPTGHEEYFQEDYYAYQGQTGFTAGNTTSTGISGGSLFPAKRERSNVPVEFVSAKRK